MELRRILVVEDEFLIALDISGVLEQAGYAVVGPAATTAEALGAIAGDVIYGALIDVNLGGESVGSVADALTRRGIPFAFVSGYGRDRLPADYQQAPLVRKPFTGKDLLEAVARFAR